MGHGVVVGERVRSFASANDTPPCPAMKLPVEDGVLVMGRRDLGLELKFRRQ